MELSPENSTSVYRHELSLGSKQPCSYDLQGCKNRAITEYSIGAGLSHVGGGSRLYACDIHDAPVRKHAENIVRLIMTTMGEKPK